jgi:hypothetical protein
MASITFNGIEIDRPAWAGATGNLLNLYMCLFSDEVMKTAGIPARG